MKTFDEEGNMKFILDEIHKTDTFYNLFKKEFSEVISKIIHEFYPEADPNEEIDNLLLSYSVAILNSTESVIDKDCNYPAYRLREELESMNRITLKLLQSSDNKYFSEALHIKTKELIVKHFSKIFNLSSTGFRLLEKNSFLYTLEFVSGFLAVSSSKSGIS